jgi:hypothetical protein
VSLGLVTKRILLRSPASPYEVIPPAAAIWRNVIANNTGNLLFLHSAYRLLDTSNVEIATDGLRVEPRDAERINESYDAYVVPFANAFRRDYEATLIRWTALIKRLRIPVVILGVGAQANLDYDLAPLAPMEKAVKQFVAAVLDRSPSIGVRGEFTEGYLRSLGFSDVEVIGCPSMFFDGPAMRITKDPEGLHVDADLVVNAVPYKAAMVPIIEHHHARYPNLVYVAQDPETLELLTFGESIGAVSRPPGFPSDLQHPLFREGKVRIFPSPWPWLDFLRERDFVFGSRIHGNIAALMAGTPSYVLAHDARTLELARYFGIPHRRLPDVDPDIDAAELYAEAIYDELNEGHAARWERFAAYLARHEIDDVFRAGEAGAFRARISALRFPVPTLSTAAELGPIDHLRLRIRRLRRNRRARGVHVALERARSRLGAVPGLGRD